MSRTNKKKPIRTIDERIQRAILRERQACADIVLVVGYSHTTGLSQYIATEFCRAADLIMNRE